MSLGPKETVFAEICSVLSVVGNIGDKKMRVALGLLLVLASADAFTGFGGPMHNAPLRIRAESRTNVLLSLKATANKDAISRRSAAAAIASSILVLTGVSETKNTEGGSLRVLCAPRPALFHVPLPVFLGKRSSECLGLRVQAVSNHPYIMYTLSAFNAMCPFGVALQTPGHFPA